jgi:hypothetical protein
MRIRNPFAKRVADPYAALVATRVHHDDYGDGTVLQADGEFLMIEFDGQLCPGVGIHVDDVMLVDTEE